MIPARSGYQGAALCDRGCHPPRTVEIEMVLRLPILLDLLDIDGEDTMIFTKCANEDCGQKYRIKSVLLGQTARCKKCNTVFQIAEYTPPSKIIELGAEDDDDTESQGDGAKKTRRSPKEVIEEQIAEIKSAVNEFLPRLDASLHN